jgi:Putative addiction module component
VRLVDHVLTSLVPAEAAIDRAWAAEIAERFANFERDDSDAEDADDVMAAALRALRR